MNNIVGKMLIVLQLVFCILFMCFAGAVYTFQGAWREEALSLQKKLDVSQQAVEDEKSSRNREFQQLKALHDEEVREMNLFRAQVENAKASDASNRQLLAQTQQERDKALADGEVASAEAAARVAESAVLNKEVQSLRGRINELIQRTRTSEDEQLDLQGKLAAAVEREELLLADNGRLRDQLRSNDIEPGEFGSGSIAESVERVDGLVVRSMKNLTRTQELLQITVGSDDRIRMDMVLTVYRGGDLVCKARVIRVYADEAICVVLEDTRKRNIQRGDNVTTKF